MLNKRFVWRQLVRSRRQAAVFVLCTALSLVTLVALGGFFENIRAALLQDQRKLQGADVIISSRFPIAEPLAAAVAELARAEGTAAARVYEFYSVVRTAGDQASLLAEIKVVGPGYPFYGRVGLRSGRSFAEALEPGTAIVEQTLLDRLQLKIGDPLQVGEATLTIADVVLAEPDRPVNFFALGPRVFVTLADLAALDLVQKGSRVSHRLLLKLGPAANAEKVAAALRSQVPAGQERVETFRSAPSRIKRFFDNLIFFLNLIGIFTLMLAGFGIYSSLSALIRENVATIAIIKTLGASGAFITRHFLAMVALLGAAGTGAGIGLGLVLQPLMPVLFADLLPEGLAYTLPWRAVAEGAIFGVLVVGIFSFLPLYRLKGFKPGLLLRKEPLSLPRGLPYYTGAGLVLALFMTAVSLRLGSAEAGGYFLLGLLALILISAALSGTALLLLRRLRLRPLAVRQAVKGLFRPGNATRTILVTLTASLTALFTIFLIEANLDAAFVRSYPPEAPNLFFLDIQPAQKDAFAELLGVPAPFFPVIRARLAAINDVPIDPAAERRRRGDRLSRTFNLTYRHHLLEDEALIAGSTLFRDDWQEPQVSVLDTVVEMQPMAVGDRLHFVIQGVPLTARIASIRTRTHETVGPFFYFVFPDALLADAPQTIFSAVRVPPEQIADLQNRVVARFPNISVVDLTTTLANFAGILRRLSGIIRFFTAFSLLAGLLIMVSSILATRLARTREAVYFKILGARGAFVRRVLTLENLFLGLTSSAIAAMLAQAASAGVVEIVLDIAYKPFFRELLAMIGGAVAVVVAVGLLASRTILRQKPADFLREQAEE